MSNVTVIDLSRNNLTGRIPPSLENCTFLDVLDLGSNSMFGRIPSCLGKLELLRSLHLNDNHFSGDLPPSLRNLSILETMDLRILILRSNAFYGKLSLEFSKLVSLQVLDLARNGLIGSIPTNLGDLKAIAQVQKKNKYLLYGKYVGHYYEESLNVYTKDQMLTYTTTLSLVTSIDLSDNDSSHESDEGRSNNDLLDKWFYLSLGLGFAAGILVPFIILTMKSSWGDVYFDFVDQVIHKLLRNKSWPEEEDSSAAIVYIDV